MLRDAVSYYRSRGAVVTAVLSPRLLEILDPPEVTLVLDADQVMIPFATAGDR